MKHRSRASGLKGGDLKTQILSHSPRFWKLFDRAASGKRTPLDALPDADDDKAWKRLAGQKRRSV